MVIQTVPDLTVEDAVIGSLVYPFNQTSFTFDTPSRFNAVSVHVRRTTTQNGEIGLFFARSWASLAAAPDAGHRGVLQQRQGLSLPASGQNLGFLPFALDKETWDGLMAGGVTDDDYRWNLDTKQVSPRDR